VYLQGKHDIVAPLIQRLHTKCRWATRFMPQAFTRGCCSSCVFLLSGLKSYGKVVYVFSLLPVVGMLVLCAKLLSLMPTTMTHQVFPETMWAEFFLNTKVSANTCKQNIDWCCHVINYCSAVCKLTLKCRLLCIYLFSQSVLKYIQFTCVCGCNLYVTVNLVD